VDPNFSAVEGEAMRLGVQFLYAQASELLKQRKERKADTKAAEPAELAQIDAAALDQLATDMEALQQVLAPYAEGGRPISADDEHLARAVEGQRRVLERILGQDLTFQGETRDTVSVRMDIDEVHGYVTGVTGTPVGSADIRMNIGSVGRGAVVTGAAFDHDAAPVRTERNPDDGPPA
jgi:hypothetical protein